MAFTKVVGAGIHTLSNITSHNIHSSGIVTATGLDISGDATIGGVLTYEDVTSIDSVGLITARNGIDCNADLDVDGHTNLDNVSIAGVSTFSGVVNANSNLTTNGTLQISSAAPILKFTETDNSKDFFIVGDGNYLSVRMDSTGGGNIIQKWNSDGSHRFNNTVKFVNDIDVDGHTNLDNVSIAGITTFASNVFLGDDDRIIFGDGGLSDAHVRYDGSHLQFGVASGSFRVSANTSSFVNYAGTQTLATINSTGVSIPLNLDVDGHTNLDNVSIAGVTTLTSSSSYPLDINGSNDAKIVLQGSTNPYIRFREGTTSKAYIQWNANGWLQLTNSEDGSGIRIKDDIVFTQDNFGSSYKIWHEGNDGSGSGLDADTLDGVQGSSFLRSDAEDTTSGRLNLTSNGQYPITIDGDHNGKIVLKGSSDPYIRFKEGTTDKAYIQWHSSGKLILANQETNERLDIGSGESGLQFLVDGVGRTVWHSGNDGSGSGLDSDTLDGVQGSSFLRSDAVDSSSEDITINGLRVGEWTSSTGYKGIYHSNQSGSEYIIMSADSHTYISATSGSNVYIRNGNNDSTNQLIVGSGNDALTWRGNKIFHAGNDGSGSGLDADTLDGVQGASFLRSDAEDTTNSQISFTTSSQYPININSSHNGKIVLQGSASPYIRFRESSTDKAYIQWDSSTGEFIMYNQESNDYLRIGSGPSGLKYTADSTTGTIWHSGNHGHGSGLNADTLDGIEGSNLLRSDTSDIMSGTLTVNDVKISSGYHLQRSNHHSGHLEGSYNNVGGNAAKSNPIYTIGSNYNPTDAALGDMYGIGFSKGSTTSFINLTGTANSWGMYVAADGDARVFLDGGTGNINAAGHLYCNRVYLDLQTSRYLSDATGNYGSIQINGGGNGTWEGYSIDGRFVFMHDGGDWGGLYNDVDNDWFVYCQRQGYVQLRYNDSPKIETTSYGIKVDTTLLMNGGNIRRVNHHTGHLEGSYNNVGANSYKSNPIYTIGSSYNPTDDGLSNMYGIGYSHGNASFTPTGAGWGMYVASDGDARLYLDAANSRVYFHNSNTYLTRGSGNSIRIQSNSGYVDIGPMNANHSHFQTDRVQFYFNKQILVDGNVIPYVTGNYNLGASTNRWNNLYVNDLQLSNESKKEEGGNDVDGTWGNFTIQEGENDLYLINNRNGKKYKFNLTEVQ